MIGRNNRKYREISISSIHSSERKFKKGGKILQVILYYNKIQLKLYKGEYIMRKKLIFLMGLLVCLSFSACGSNDSDNKAKNDADTDAHTIDANENEATEKEVSVNTEMQEEPTEPDADTVYNIGESAVLGDWEISITDVQFVESISADYGKFSPDSEDGRYVQVFVTVVNNGKQADNFLPTYGFGDDVNAKVLYGDGYEFSATNLLGYSKEMHDSVINPLSSKDGEIAFEVPSSVTDTDEELLVRFSSGNDSVAFKLR